MLYQDNYFAVSAKLNFCQGQTRCIDDQDKVQPVADTNNEFTECQTPREKLQSIGISPVTLHTFRETLKRSIKSIKVQVDCLNNSESDFYNKNDMQKKVNVLVRLHEVMQEKSKTASYSEPIQILTLVPDKWSQMYCSEYFNVFEYLV